MPIPVLLYVHINCVPKTKHYTVNSLTRQEKTPYIMCKTNSKNQHCSKIYARNNRENKLPTKHATKWDMLKNFKIRHLLRLKQLFLKIRKM